MVREEAEDWLAQGERDLRTARNCLQAGDYYAAAFFAQQAAEKALKALCIIRLKEFPTSHNLVRIAKQLNAPDDIVQACRSLTPVYTTARYPNAAMGPPFELFDRELAERHLREAGLVVEWVKRSLRR